MTLHGADPALFRTDDGDRLALDEDFGRVKVDHRRLGTVRAAGIDLHESRLHLADFRRDPLPLQIFVANQRRQLLALGNQAVAFRLQRHLLEATQ